MKDRIKNRRRHRIQGISDMSISGNILDCKQCTGIVNAVPKLHHALVGKKGGRLGEKDRECSSANIHHRIRGILSDSLVREVFDCLSQASNHFFKGEDDSWYVLHESMVA